MTVKTFVILVACVALGRLRPRLRGDRETGGSERQRR